MALKPGSERRDIGIHCLCPVGSDFLETHIETLGIRSQHFSIVYEL